MGIPGLSKALDQYAVLTTLEGSVVIDGPALVYRLWESMIKDQPVSSLLLCQISYSSLGQSLIGWLDGLRAEGVHVRKIYFDGFLPPRKWDVRLSRLIGQSRNMREATSPYRPSGVSPAGAASPHKHSEHTALVFPKYRAAGQSLPKHPFLVPAAIEALRNSPYWNSVLQVVPGEADAFCARDIRQNGGTVLTSDSDLLIEDLGPEGSVVFFWDIVEKTARDKDAGLAARKYSLQELETRLHIRESGGLSRMAFEFVSRKASIGEALRYTQTTDGTDRVREDAYQQFLGEHLPEEYISEDHPVVSVLSALDPRISELVIQALNIEVIKSETSPKGAHRRRGPEELSIFLPVMIEDDTKKSSWTMSESIRQLAYGIVQYSDRPRRDRIIEYRTLETTVGGRQLAIPDATTVDISCGQLLATLKGIKVNMTAPHSQWLAFAIYRDIEWSDDERRSPISVALVSEAVLLKGEASIYHWDIIHFTAHVQACLYSLRILKQTLDVMATLSPTGLSESKRQLRSHLSTLPSIEEYPTTEDMFRLLSQFGKAKGLAAVSGILGISDLRITKPVVKSKKVKPAKPKKQARPPQPTSSNPFALLGEERDR